MIKSRGDYGGIDEEVARGGGLKRGCPFTAQIKQKLAWIREGHDNPKKVAAYFARE